MPRNKRKVKSSQINLAKAREKIARLDLNNNEEYPDQLRSEMNNEPDNFFDGIVQENNKSCQTEIHLKDAATQTDNLFSTYFTSVISNFNFNNVQDLICILFDSISNYNFKHRRVLSIIVYLLLRLVQVSFEAIRTVLENINLLNIQTCHSWCLTIIDEDDICVILRDERGAHKHVSFYDNFPELEQEAKAFALTKACQKKCAFNVNFTYFPF